MKNIFTFDYQKCNFAASVRYSSGHSSHARPSRRFRQIAVNVPRRTPSAVSCGSKVIIHGIKLNQKYFWLPSIIACSKLAREYRIPASHENIPTGPEQRKSENRDICELKAQFFGRTSQSPAGRNSSDVIRYLKIKTPCFAFVRKFDILQDPVTALRFCGIGFLCC